MNQIERLQNNLCQYQYLSAEDKEFFHKAGSENMLMLKTNGSWSDVYEVDEPAAVYRLRPDYQPEPANPAFPGMVLCKVFCDGTGRIRYEDELGAGMAVFIDWAIRYGCIGYVFEESPDMLSLSPTAFYIPDGNGALYYSVSASGLKSGKYKPATLRYVVFPEKK